MIKQYRPFSAEEIEMMVSIAPYPCVIVLDRYSGVYSGGRWTAFSEYEVPEGATDSDIECATFWQKYDKPYGVGNDPLEALRDLILNRASRVNNE